jgi:hypothetical protein
MKSYDKIKNFSTSIDASKTIGEIELMLTKFGITKILKEYDENGLINMLTFAIRTKYGEMPVKLPINIQGIMNVFKIQVSNNKLPRKFWGSEWSKEQAYRVGWRILKDWLDSQLNLLSIEMVKIEEIFLPYIYNPSLGKTIFEMIEGKKFNLALEDKSISDNQITMSDS